MKIPGLGTQRFAPIFGVTTDTTLTTNRKAPTVRIEITTSRWRLASWERPDKGGAWPASGQLCRGPGREIAGRVVPDFTIQGLRRRCAPKHRKVHRERPVATRQCPCDGAWSLCK